MGMYDTLYILEKSSLKCACGHEINRFQTKDLDNMLNEYYLFKNKRLYCVEKDYSKLDRPNEYTLEKDNLIIIYKSKCNFVSFSGKINAYSECRQCKPICYRHKTWAHDYVDHMYPWIEYCLIFEKGIVKDIEVVRADTREQLKKSVSGCLPDNNRIVKKHLELLNKRTKRI